MTIVTTHYQPKRTRKKKPAVALTGPRITTPLIRRAPTPPPDEAEQPTPSGNDYQMPKASESGGFSMSQRTVIVTAKNPRRGRFGDVPDMTPEEHQRRGDAAEALFRELVRRVRGE
jgi:hypothetical protein